MLYKLEARSFKFGTTGGYRATEKTALGRLSDSQEGSQWEVFNSRSGMFKRFNRDNIQLNDVEFMGFENQVAIEYTVNDYCACLSIGEFSEERANLIRVRGNNDIGAYVVYDIIKLRMTISEILIDSIDKRDFAILSRNIVYGLKDRKWDVEDTLSIIKDRNTMALWLGATFVKNEIFRHE